MISEITGLLWPLLFIMIFAVLLFEIKGISKNLKSMAAGPDRVQINCDIGKADALKKLQYLIEKVFQNDDIPKQELLAEISRQIKAINNYILYSAGAENRAKTRKNVNIVARVQRKNGEKAAARIHEISNASMKFETAQRLKVNEIVTVTFPEEQRLNELEQFPETVMVRRIEPVETGFIYGAQDPAYVQIGAAA